MSHGMVGVRKRRSVSVVTARVVMSLGGVAAYY